MSRGGDKALPSGMPNCLKKRRLLNEKELSPQMCRELGEKFLALEWWEDALEFFQKGGCREGLDRLEALALENGDAFLLSRLKKERDPDFWSRVAGTALSLGKLAFARRALELAGDKEKAGEISRLIMGEERLH
jgi:hypothetical protein